MLLLSGGDIRTIRVKHVWELRDHLQPVTCRATATANYALTHEPSGNVFRKFYRKPTRRLHVVSLSLSPDYVYELCLLRSVTIGYERWYRAPH